MQNNTIPDIVKKYLNKYSFRLEDLSAKADYECIVVIPILDEFENLGELCSSLAVQSKHHLAKTLFVFVVNNSEDASNDVLKNNLASINLLNQLKSKKEINIAVIDASTKGNELPLKTAGVGLARKIGMDSALGYFNYKSKNKKFLVCLDGDCTVSSNYLEDLFSIVNKEKLNAGYVKYHHLLSRNEEINRAIIVYEIFLRYYVLGLKYAASPYAFHTIGSTMFCDYEHYIKIEGMNKRKAAEDFYFMEKLSKVCKISEISSAFVYPSPRPSWRVPFGTGQRVNRFLSKSQNEYLLYPFESFDILKKWLQIFNSAKAETAEYYLNESKNISIHLYNFLINNNFEPTWNNIIINSAKSGQLILQKKTWFDGFRTLKLIHYLRDNGFDAQNMFYAVDQMLNKSGLANPPKRTEEIPSLTVQLEYLEILRKLA